eukprot:gene4093-4647_t
MAVIKTYVSLLLILIVNFRVKKLAFVSSDSIGLSIDGSSIEICPGPVSERRYNPELEHLINQRGLKILHQNVRGLFANHVYICKLIRSFKGINILTLSETHLESNDTDANEMLKIPGYIFVSKPRPTGKGGGVAAYISEKLICDRSTNGKDFKSILNLFGLKQLIQKPTRITNSTSTLIDIIGTNNPATIRDARVIPTGIGDHDMVGCVRKINLTREAPRQITCRNYRNYDSDKMSEDLRNSDWLRVLNYVEVNKAWGYMKDILSGVFNKHTPKIQKIVKGKVAPWLNEGVKRLMNERDKVLRKFRKTKAEVDQAAYKEKRNAVNVAMRKAKSSYHRKLLSENAGNPNRFWRTIRSIYPSKPKNSNISIHFNIDEEQ